MEPATLRRVGLPTTRRTRRLFSRRDADPGGPPRGLFREDPTAPTGVLGRAEPGTSPARSMRLLQRAGAGLLAGGLVLGGARVARARPVLLERGRRRSGGARDGAAAAPRLAAAAFALCAWLVSPEADRQGTALVLAAAAAPSRSCCRAPACSGRVPVLAPLLGTVALGACLRRRRRARPDRLAPRRAGRIAGFWWLALGGADRRGAPVRVARRHAASGRLGGLDLSGRLRRAAAARDLARAGPARRVGRRSRCAAAGGPRPLARHATASAPAVGRGR